MNILRKIRPHVLSGSWFWIALMIASAVIGFSNAEATFLGVFIVIYGVPAWLMTLLVRVLVWWIRQGRGKGRILPRPWLSWSIEPMVFAIVIALIAVGGFKWARFAISYPWLSSKARFEIAEMSVTGPQKWQQYEDGFLVCGLYRVRQWETGFATDGSPQFLLITAYMTLTDAAGWAYVPSGAKPKGIRTGQPCYFEHMVGPWWRWRLDV